LSPPNGLKYVFIIYELITENKVHYNFTDKTKPLFSLLFIKKILLAGFSACGGSLQRYLPFRRF